MKLRIGTRGSDLALWQTDWVAQALSAVHADLELERVIIKTHGDLLPDRNFGGDWPVGAFVSALENALRRNDIDIAVHSYKDLQTAVTRGLTIAATPPRAAVHDVLLTRRAETLAALPPGARIGTNSPRRGAQLRQLLDCEIVPIRGNVPTRIRKLAEAELDAIVLAAAGLERLGIDFPRTLALSLEQMLPAPAQGALAVQTRMNDPAADVVRVLDDAVTRQQVSAERALLAQLGAGCHTPVAAHAVVAGATVTLTARLFSDDGTRFVAGSEQGSDAEAVGRQLADRLRAELG